MAYNPFYFESMENNKLPIDELNILQSYLLKLQASGKPLDKQEIIDSVEDLIIMSYVFGVDYVNGIFGKDIKPDPNAMKDAVYKKIEGKDFIERVGEYVDDDDIPSILRVVDTESHRVYNESVFDNGKKSGAKTKTWHTQLDNRVRDSHDYLEGMTIDINDEFYTYNGNHTYYPGQFGVASEDINCRCFLSYN